MYWQFENNRPIYSQICQKLQQAILKGDYPTGSRLPGVRELATEAGVNPNTMQRALAELEEQGLVLTQSTNGRFVTTAENVLNKSREDLAKKLSLEYTVNMFRLGLNSEKIFHYISMVAPEADPENIDKNNSLGGSQ